jgi:hypothetical protein
MTIRSFKMKRYSIFFLAFLFALNGRMPSAASKIKYRAFSPSDAGKSVFLKSGSKQYKYFELGAGQTMEFTVKGPTRIKVRTRAALGGNLSSGEYEVTIWEGNKIRTGRKAETKKSKLAVNDGNDPVGLARDVIFKVPKGNHTYRVAVNSDRIDKFFLRFYQEKKKAKKTLSYGAFRPAEYARREKLKTSKSQISYYFIDEKGGVKLKVVGPTKIRINCRANFDPTMKGKAKFTLGVFENGKSVEKFSGIAEKSKKYAFLKVPDVIPSTMKKFTLDVPEGEHQYEFRKLNSSPSSLAVRFEILKSSLGKKK